MQKNLLIKLVIIVGILLVFLYGIFGFAPLSGHSLKEAVLNRIHLGLDLKGGTHMILQVNVDEAVSGETDRAVEELKDELNKSQTTYTNIARDANRVDQFVVQGVPPNATSAVRSIITDRLATYVPASGPNGTLIATMKPDVEAKLRTDTVDKSIEAIRQRVDSLGVSEPVIQRNGLGGENQILVELPGVDDLERAKAIIQSTARLELRESRGVFASAEDARKAQPNGLLPPNMELLPSKSDNRVYLVSRVAVVGGTDIRDATAGTKGETGEPIINFYLNPEPAKKFGEFTEAHREGGPDPANLAIVLEGKVVTAPSIKSRITDQGMIEGGGMTAEEAKDQAMLLRSGALPASLTYLTERTVGASLGADSIRSGVKAAVAGMLGVMIFMLIYYRGAGINADLALVLNLIILLGFMGFFGAVLTLPGIAGVILTVGMGVDSNVLIFERIREELRNGKAPAAAVDQGFDRAWTTILDTHVTTIVSALILFFVGSGPVSGFGLTLIFGLLANLFTAVFVSRVIFDAGLSRKARGAALSI